MQWATTEADILTRNTIPIGDAAATSVAGASSVAVVPALAASTSVASSNTPSHVSGLRISQLDALALDSELGWMLGAQLRRACKFLSGGGWVSDHKAECELLLHATMFLCTLGRDRPTPGMKLQNLQFQNYVAMRILNAPASNANKANWLSWWNNWLSRWLGGVTHLLGSHDGASSLSKLKEILPSTSGVSSSTRSTIPLSHFAPVPPNPIDTTASLLHDTADSTGTAEHIPPAVLLSSVPSTAPIGLSRAQKVLYFTGSVLLRYCWARLNHRMTMEGWGGYPEGDWHRRVYKLARNMEHAYQALNIINFIAFLHNGWSGLGHVSIYPFSDEFMSISQHSLTIVFVRYALSVCMCSVLVFFLSYRTLLERLLSLRLLYSRPRVSRQVSFEFMNQQIAWQALSDFMLFILPLINFDSIGKLFMWTGRTIGLLPPIPTASANSTGVGSVSLVEAMQVGCPCCHLAPASQPYIAHPCGHIFCYYCLSGNRLAASSQARNAGGHSLARADFCCPACNQPITAQSILQTQITPPAVGAAADALRQQRSNP
jgi:hypothetical protein